MESKTRDINNLLVPDEFSLPQGNKIFFGIGINAYQSWSRLNNAVRDVENISTLLSTHYKFDTVKLLKDETATASNIEQELYNFTLPGAIGEHDSLLIYYSGHGHIDPNGRGYWVPVDAAKGKISTYLPNSRIRELISDIKCRHILLISDSCFSGSFFVKGVRGADEVADEYEKRISRWAFCSGRADEVVSDGRPGDNSPFASAILGELSLNVTKKLNIARLADKVIEITRSNYKQMPEANPIQDAGHRGGQFVFTPATYNEEKDIRVPSQLPRQFIDRQAAPSVPPPNIISKQLLIGGGLFLVLLLVTGIGFWVGWFDPAPKKPEILVTVPVVEQDTIVSGETTHRSFSVENKGSVLARLQPFSFSAPDLSLPSNRSFNLEPGAAKTFNITWKPKNTGLQLAKIIVNGTDIQDTVQVRVFVKDKPGVQTSPKDPIPSKISDNSGKKAETKSGTKPSKPEPTDETGISQSDKPVEPTVPQMVEIRTNIPTDIKMWLITDSKKRYDAKLRNGELIFEVPRDLRGKRVKVYFRKNGKEDWDSQSLTDDGIQLPDGF
jgi:hypothetical protein